MEKSTTISKKHVAVMVRLKNVSGGAVKLMQALKARYDDDQSYLTSPCGWVTMEHVIFLLWGPEKFKELIIFIDRIYRPRIRVLSEPVDAFYTAAKNEVKQEAKEDAWEEQMEYNRMERRWDLNHQLDRNFPDFPLR
jgi:Sec-independent protein translocase protein TatA